MARQKKIAPHTCGHIHIDVRTRLTAPRQSSCFISRAAPLQVNIALCLYKTKQYGPALKNIAEVIEKGVREHPELSVGSNTDGIDVRSVGNSVVLQETCLVEAFNLKVRLTCRRRHRLFRHHLRCRRCRRFCLQLYAGVLLLPSTCPCSFQPSSGSSPLLLLPIYPSSLYLYTSLFSSSSPLLTAGGYFSSSPLWTAGSFFQAAIEHAMGNMDMAKEALSDMPPREEHELDPVTLHNQVC